MAKSCGSYKNLLALPECRMLPCGVIFLYCPRFDIAFVPFLLFGFRFNDKELYAGYWQLNWRYLIIGK